MKRTRYITLYLISFVLFACQPEQTKTEIKEAVSTTHKFSPTKIKYASNFSIQYFDSIKIIHIPKPYPGSTNPARYVLALPGASIPDSLANETLVRVPVDEVVMTSTTYLPALDMLSASDALVGFPDTKLISSPKILQLVSSGKVKNLGNGSNLNIETLLSLEPDMIMAYSMGAGDQSIETLKRANIPLILNAEYLEDSPLGRAEWIKFTAAFLNKEEEADSVFTYIVHAYDSLTQLAQKAEKAPSTFSGVVYNGTWFMPGGKSWPAQFLKDANADFLWSKNEATGSVQLSFESVFDKAHDADFWINASNYTTLEAMGAADERYKQFRAWKTGQVYNPIAQTTPEGGNAYFELGYARPDLIMADLIRILHPDLLLEHQLYFYRKLN